jgi:hypothetical protein
MSQTSRQVTKKELLRVFESLCSRMGKTSAGFDASAITAPIDGPKHDGKSRWAMKHTKGLGWMVVRGTGGCGAALSRWDGYMRTRRSFLLMMEAVIWALDESRRKSIS